MLTAKVSLLTAHCYIIGALIPDRQSQISYRRVNAPIARRLLQLGRAPTPRCMRRSHRGLGPDDGTGMLLE